MKRLFLILCCLIIPFLVQAQQAPGHGNDRGRHLGNRAENFDVDSMRNAIPEAALNNAKSVQKRHEHSIITRPGVVAMGVGVSSVDGITPIIKVYMDSSSATASIPTSFEGVDVELVEAGTAIADAPVPSRDTLPALMGHQLGLPSQWAGTLGFRAHRVGHPDEVGFVTNNHVAAMGWPNGTWGCPTAINEGNIELSEIAPFNRTVCFPGTCTYDIGNLVQTVPLVLDSNFANTVDAAFISSDRSLVSDDVIGLEPINNNTPIEPFLMLPVAKHGATTGLTTGYVDTVNTTVNVGYNCGTARFVNQVIISPNPSFPTWSDSGDSGSSVWVNNTNPQLVGLHFAHFTFTGQGIINPITAVLGALAVVPDVSGSDEPPPNQVAVPDVIGQEEATARTMITNANLVVGDVLYAPHAAPDGTVYDQEPNGGVQVDEGSAVDLWVSTGSGNVVVPSVIGMAEASAVIAIQNAGLVVCTISRANNAAPVGTVIGQEPTGGTSVPLSSCVNLTISLGPGTVAVPNVINMSEAAATTAIQNAGLVVGTVTRVQNAAPVGTVIGQSPVGGTQVELGSEVDLTISLGPGGPVLQPVFREAESFDTSFRIQVETGTPSSGGANIGYIEEGSFTQYLIDFTPGDSSALNHTYTLRFTYANWDGAKTVTVWDTYSGTTATINLPEHGAGYWNWYTTSIPFTISSDALNGGTTEIRFTYHGGSMNVDSIEFLP